MFVQVFAGVYPMDQSEHGQLKAAIERLCLNDRSVSVSMESRSDFRNFIILS